MEGHQLTVVGLSTSTQPQALLLAQIKFGKTLTVTLILNYIFIMQCCYFVNSAVHWFKIFRTTASSEYNIHSLVKLTFNAQALGSVGSVLNQRPLTVLVKSSLSPAKDAPHNHLILGYFNLRISAAHKLILTMVD